MNFADYSWRFVTPGRARAQADYLHVLTSDGVLVVFDKNLGQRSLTNDMAAVLDEVAGEEHRRSLDGVRVTYRDSQGEFCRVLLNEQGRFAGFRSFGKRVTDEAEAVALLRQMPA